MKIEDAKKLVQAAEIIEQINSVIARVEENRSRFFDVASNFFSGLGVPLGDLNDSGLRDACNAVVDSVVSIGNESVISTKAQVESIDKEAVDSIGVAVAIEEPK